MQLAFVNPPLILFSPLYLVLNFCIYILSLCFLKCGARLNTFSITVICMVLILCPSGWSGSYRFCSPSYLNWQFEGEHLKFLPLSVIIICRMTREELLTTMVVRNPWKRQTKLMLFWLIEYQEMKENNSTMTYSMNEKDFLKFTSYRHLVKYMFQLWCAFFHAFTSSMDFSVCSPNLK